MKVIKIKPNNMGMRGIDFKHRKEQHFQDEITGFVFHRGGFIKIVTLRTYGTKNTNFACLWVYAPGSYTNGSGKAGGFGYHRPSAAAERAFEAAGVVLSEPIEGRGDIIMEEAVQAIVYYFYPRNKHILIHKAHP